MQIPNTEHYTAALLTNLLDVFCLVYEQDSIPEKQFYAEHINFDISVSYTPQ